MAKMTQEVAEALGELLKMLPDAPRGEPPEAKERRRKAKAIKAATFKTKRFAHYLVGPQGAYAEGRLYQPGEVIRLPLHAEPSYTFKAVDKDGVAMAEEKAAREAAELEASAGAAADDDALDADELAAESTSAENAEEDELDEEPEVKPAPPPGKAKAKVRPAPKRGKAGKRASDQDVA